MLLFNKQTLKISHALISDIYLQWRDFENARGNSLFSQWLSFTSMGRGTEMGWVEMLKILEYTAYSYSVSNCPAPKVDKVCGSQPPRWLPEIPTSWDSHMYIFPSTLYQQNTA